MVVKTPVSAAVFAGAPGNQMIWRFIGDFARGAHIDVTEFERALVNFRHKRKNGGRRIFPWTTDGMDNSLWRRWQVSFRRAVKISEN
jgi:hypothetical protein